MSVYRCQKCRKGLLKPVVDNEHETELSETFICTECQHKTKIPAAMIVFSQILSSLIGGVFAAYLCIEQLSVFVTLIQFGIDGNLTRNVTLLIISLLFLMGFGYTLFVGLQGWARRNRYLRAENRVETSNPEQADRNLGHTE